jgi:serine/threonine protein kinase
VHTIPGYHIKTALGEGGMASVFLATQKSLERPVAIKVLDATLNRDETIQQQFAQESKIIAQLNHPNIIQVIDQGATEQGLPYFVMPYVKSIPLDAILQRDDVNITRKLDILIQICAALAYAHRNGVIHRDIKPANVLVDYDGHVRLVDFGIAGYFTANKPNSQPVAEELVMGTGAYMAPEQRNGTSHTSHLSDIYSLGILMHEVVYGVQPIMATEANYQPLANDKYNLAALLRPIIEECIQVTPQKRPQSVEEMRQSLLLIAQGRHLRTNRWGLESTRDNMPPNYTLLDVLKENPFGATYLVNDPNRHRLLVIKKQHLEHLGNAPVCAAKLTHIQHPHVARIFGTGKNPRVFIVASEYLAAGSLQDRLTQAFSLGQWILIAQQLCNALACAHSYGIIHGNLRPSNVLFAENNHLKLSDFGFPAHTYGDESHWYHPPNESISAATDIYAAGAILFQLLSGKTPSDAFWGLKNRIALRHLPKSMRSIILQMIAKDPKKRIASAEAAALAFNQVQEQQKTQILEKIVSFPS